MDYKFTLEIEMELEVGGTEQGYPASTSNPTIFRLSLLNSTPIRWIGWLRARYISA
jgi:hypothetical protein